MHRSAKVTREKVSPGPHSTESLPHSVSSDAKVASIEAVLPLESCSIRYYKNCPYSESTVWMTHTPA